MSAHPRVVQVLTREGTDIAAICNEAADRYGLPPRALVALGIAESDLTERAARFGRRTAEALECIRVLMEAGEWP